MDRQLISRTHIYIKARLKILLFPITLYQNNWKIQLQFNIYIYYPTHKHDFRDMIKPSLFYKIYTSIKVALFICKVLNTFLP
jgi:hypothetical protein